MLRFRFFQSLAISLFAVSMLSGCNPAYYDPIVPEVLVGQGVHRDGGTCYFMIIWEIDTEPHFPEHFRNWGYRIRVENSGEEFLTEEYKTIEDLNLGMKKLYETEIVPLMKKEGLSTTVYTQLTDVEQEINGLVTYDRKITKIDPELMRSLNAMLKF